MDNRQLEQSSELKQQCKNYESNEPKDNKSSNQHHAAMPKQNKVVYYFIRFLAWVVSKFVFKRKFLRNEIKGKKGPFVIIANHEAALDFVNLIGATRRPITFVISNSFYSTLPCRPIVSRFGMLPKQQFQTSLKDICSMKSAIDNGKILAIYPAGLMSDDGNSTPIPVATYSFLKWIKADIYVARTVGTYFSMPKWRKGGLRRGRTYMDIYKLFDKDEIGEMDVELIRERTIEAIDFDAYDDQEKHLVKYKKSNNIEGLEDVLYMCPHCHKEFTVEVRDKSVIYCKECGYAQKADEYGFLHKISEVGEEIRHPSKWGVLIHNTLKSRIEAGIETEMSTKVTIHMIDKKTKKYAPCGEGELTLSKEHFSFVGKIREEDTELTIPIAPFASLPFKPGKYFEIQNGQDIFRCYPEDGRIVTKLVYMVQIYYDVHNKECEQTRQASHSAK